MEPPVQTLYWVLVALTLYTLMFVVVPTEQVVELSRFGFWFGLVLALFVLGAGQHLGLFRVPGDPKLFGIPLIASISWIPPVVIFARYFHWARTTSQIAMYILVFAIGSTVVQFLMRLLGMWESIHWNPVYTFLLALGTHSLMTGYLLLRRQRMIGRN